MQKAEQAQEDLQIEDRIRTKALQYSHCADSASGGFSGASARPLHLRYFNQGNSNVFAFSPVKGENYTVDCSYTNFVAHLSSGMSHRGVPCTGGIGAAVVIC